MAFIKLLEAPLLLQTAETLPRTGKLKISKDNLVYLRIDDAYIHQLFPLIQQLDCCKPNYFGENAIGAHISVMYPDEYKNIALQDLNQLHHFKIQQLAHTQLDNKQYCILLVSAPSLAQLRKKYQLPDMLILKNHPIPFHITLGVKEQPLASPAPHHGHTHPLP